MKQAVDEIQGNSKSAQRRKNAKRGPDPLVLITFAKIKKSPSWNSNPRTLALQPRSTHPLRQVVVSFSNRTGATYRTYIEMCQFAGLKTTRERPKSVLYLQKFGYSVLGQMGALVFEPLPPP